MFMFDVVDGSRRLEDNFAPYINGNYFAIIHPNVYIYLQTETTVGAFIDVSKYSRPDMVFAGEIGMFANVRIIRTPFIKTFASTVKVYPTVFL